MDLNGLVNYDHSKQVSRICGILALCAGYSPEEAGLIEQAALYHDIGKCDIPDAILNKPGALSPEEFAIVKTHTLLGRERISKELQILGIASVMASQHHERLDGNGYMGLKGDEIDAISRLTAVADVFDALLSRRAYKPAWTKETVLEYMRENAGTHFDPHYVNLLLSHTEDVLAVYQGESGYPV